MITSQGSRYCLFVFCTARRALVLYWRFELYNCFIIIIIIIIIIVIIGVSVVQLCRNCSNARSNSNYNVMHANIECTQSTLCIVVIHNQHMIFVLMFSCYEARRSQSVDTL